ncbi:MAG: thioredoxin family protein, partial [Gemmataceae bacterium]|nr:thioredoxin family protein [Gemmataceae bacterium]
MNAISSTTRLICGSMLAVCGVLLLSMSAVAQPMLPDPADLVDVAGNIFADSIKEKLGLKATITPQTAKRGEIVKIVITGYPKSDTAHTYSANKTHVTQIGKPSAIAISKSDGLTPLFPIEETNLHVEKKERKEGSETSYELNGNFTWTQEFLVPENIDPGTKEIVVQVQLMACDNKGCSLYGKYDPLRLRLIVSPEQPVSTSVNVAERTKAPKIEVIGKETAEPKSNPVRGKDDVPAAKAEPNAFLPPGKATSETNIRNDLPALLWGAFLGAFLMLLTPCVFPMIPITVNFFIKQSEKEHHKPFLTAAIYAGTIVLLLTGVILLIGELIIPLADNGYFNLALGLVLILFALSLFGMYELELPHFLSRFTSSREGRGGYVGTIFMALTFTITSFTCTGPFLAMLMAPVAGLQPPRLNLVLASVVYSATFAAPFFLLALFPSFLKKLPKSGGWMNVVKVTMGFLELGAALKFLANFDFALHPGNARFFNYDTVLCAWIALSLASAFYLFDLFRLPHDDESGPIGVLRMVVGTMFLGMAFYMTPLLFGIKPRGIVMEGIVAFLPPRTGQGTSFGSQSEHLTWSLDHQEAIAEARAANKLIFIDFTGVNCTNCRDNEENVFTRKEVIESLKKYVRLQLYTDTVPNPKLTSQEAAAQATRNVIWEKQLINRTSRPAYVVFDPRLSGVDPFSDAYKRTESQSKSQMEKLEGTVLDYREGIIADVPDFLRFLNAPLQTPPAHAVPADAKVAA